MIEMTRASHVVLAWIRINKGMRSACHQFVGYLSQAYGTPGIMSAIYMTLISATLSPSHRACTAYFSWPDQLTKVGDSWREVAGLKSSDRALWRSVICDSAAAGNVMVCPMLLAVSS